MGKEIKYNVKLVINGNGKSEIELKKEFNKKLLNIILLNENKKQNIQMCESKNCTFE